MWSVPSKITTSSSCAPVNVFDFSTTVPSVCDIACAPFSEALNEAPNAPVTSSNSKPTESERLEPVDDSYAVSIDVDVERSEERRVGKECRLVWARDH